VWQNVSVVIKQTITGLPARNIRIEVVDPLPEVFADHLFGKVFYNLIDNAFRYGGEKMTTIRIYTRKSEAGAVIFVEDDGAGIMPGDKERLFERGFGKNTGLGLFLSREILSITGITITETGEPGKGARFEILVPEGKFRFHSH
ncbi:MAG: HAMP domain-containing sensor histidine kinase, partial [Methanoregula sp.]